MAEAPLVVMTTNYDQGIETAFDEAGCTYHLFVYQAHGEFEGRFVYCTPTRAVRVVKRPENLLELGDGQPVIVKLNGGPAPAPEVQDSFAVATRDYYFLATRIPQILPACLTPLLETRSLLFLGHGLNEPDVEEIIRYRHRHGGQSWALQYAADPSRTGPDPTVRQYWEELGVDLLWGDIDAFVGGLETAL